MTIEILGYKFANSELNKRIAEIVALVEIIAQPDDNQSFKQAANSRLHQLQGFINPYNEHMMNVGFLFASRNKQAACDIVLQFGGQILDIALGAVFAGNLQYADTLIASMSNHTTNSMTIAKSAILSGKTQYADTLISDIIYIYHDATSYLNSLKSSAEISGNTQSVKILTTLISLINNTIKSYLNVFAAIAAFAGNRPYTEYLIANIGGDSQADLNIIAKQAGLSSNPQYAAELRCRVNITRIREQLKSLSLPPRNLAEAVHDYVATRDPAQQRSQQQMRQQYSLPAAAPAPMPAFAIPAWEIAARHTEQFRQQQIPPQPAISAAPAAAIAPFYNDVRTVAPAQHAVHSRQQQMSLRRYTPPAQIAISVDSNPDIIYLNQTEEELSLQQLMSQQTAATSAVTTTYAVLRNAATIPAPKQHAKQNLQRQIPAPNQLTAATSAVTTTYAVLRNAATIPAPEQHAKQNLQQQTPTPKQSVEMQTQRGGGTISEFTIAERAKPAALAMQPEQKGAAPQPVVAQADGASASKINIADKKAPATHREDMEDGLILLAKAADTLAARAELQPNRANANKQRSAAQGVLLFAAPNGVNKRKQALVVANLSGAAPQQKRYKNTITPPSNNKPK